MLLGDPGAGKTTAFESEAAALGDAAHPVSARDFLALGDPPALPAGTTLFIDGLDEIRAGRTDRRSPFDQIRKRLQDLERPRFRLSCREADWLGDCDRAHLAKVAPGGDATVLRLDPLTEDDIERILSSSGIDKPARLVAKARERGLGGLLKNPQTLHMLTDVVGGSDQWPDSRREIFERACHRLAGEHNAEHRAASPTCAVPPPEQILDAAGRLCAFQVLTGAAGHSLDPVVNGERHLDPYDCDYEPPELLWVALGTKLFKGDRAGLTPIHRHIAEYLAARHLARLVTEHKLPAGRVVALMLGDDGAVVSEMRGLSAWLAALCREARRHLIDRDPVGVGLYGDISSFTLDEKRALLEALARDASWRDLGFGFASRFRTLATRDMEAVFQDVLSAPPREGSQPFLPEFLLHILRESAPLPGLARTLVRIVRDTARPTRVRTLALQAYCERHHGPERPETLKALVEDTRQRRVGDSNNDLLGTVLAALDLDEIAPRELWEIFAERPLSDTFGPYRLFWEYDLGQRIPDHHLAEHLDHLGGQLEWLRQHDPKDRLRHLRFALVARGLARHGGALVDRGDIARIFDWLGVAANDSHILSADRRDEEHIRTIREWLEERPEIAERLDAKWPGSDRVVAEWEVAEGRRERQRASGKAKELADFRSHRAALKTNQAKPGLLHNLAGVYFGDFKRIATDADAGVRAIEEWCLGDRELTQAILAGLRGVVSRDELPALKDICRAYRESRFYYLSLPLLAGLAEADRTASQAQFPCGDPSLAVALYLATWHGQYNPRWFRRVLNESPEIVADVQVQIAGAGFRGGRTVDCKLRRLALDDTYAAVARISAPRLLRAFPTQAKRTLSEQLEYLLVASLKHADPDVLREVVESKLSRSSLAMWQRVSWLATGFIAWPDAFGEALRDYVKAGERRMAELTDFLGRAGSVLAERAQYREAGLLVSILASSTEPEPFTRRGGVQSVTPTMHRSWMVHSLIRWISSSQTDEARQALRALLGDKALSAWQHELREADRVQSVIRRDHGYRHPTAEQLRNTLRGAEPANVADLSALVTDHLKGLASEMEGGDADGWRPFWNEDGHRKKTTPKNEGSCRDEILRELRRRLPPGVDVAPERRHARGTQSDHGISHMTSTGEKLYVPIEIKKSSSPDLDTAIENQLIPKYTTDPAAKGHGIFLVLWFGNRHRSSLDGYRPDTAEDLEAHLQASLSDKQKRKIALCVLDVSGDPPAGG